MKVGFTCSPFDLLHAGHIEMLRECKENCDYLICGINTKPEKKGKFPVKVSWGLNYHEMTDITEKFV